MLKLYAIVFHLDHCRLLHDFWHCGFPCLNFLHLDLMLNMVRDSRMLREFVLRWPCVTGPHLWTNSLLQFYVVDKWGNCKEKSSCLLPLGLIWHLAKISHWLKVHHVVSCLNLSCVLMWDKLLNVFRQVMFSSGLDFKENCTASTPLLAGKELIIMIIIVHRLSQRNQYFGL